MGLSLRFFTFMHLVFLLSFSHVALASFPSVRPLCHDDERSALLQFKESFIFNSTFCYYSSDYSKVAMWKAEEENTDCCSWDGVTCNEDTGHVIRLDLANCCLHGSINSSISLSRLVHLEWLSLAYNYFNYSQIPSEFMNLTMLSYLNLSYTFISGEMPSEILELSKLETLDLSRNFFLKGYLPEFEKESSLKELILSETGFFGEIPKSIGNLKSLLYLDISWCNFRGIIPSSIGNLTQIIYLDLSYNKFSGQIPSSFSNLTQLGHLGLSNFMFPGELPAFMGNLRSLKELDICYCNLLGQPLSSVLGNLTQLNLLDVSSNDFSSQNSLSFSWISKLTKLTDLNLANIDFVGEIPSSFKNLTQLTKLDMSNNQLTGPLPYWLMNLSQLRLLRLISNQLTGGIPTQIKNLTQLESLDLSFNQFQGSIPSSIFELERLNILDLTSNNLSGVLELDTLLSKPKDSFSSNQLTGPLRYWRMNLSQLRVLWLSSNQLTGGIPTQIKNLKKLEILDLSSNQFQGLIPSSIFELERLKILDLTSNNLSGVVELDTLLSKPKDSFILLLSSNKLSLVTKKTVDPISHSFFESVKLNSCNLSEFPSFLCNQDNLLALDLSSNHIHGEIPGWLLNVSRDSLEYLNLSHNLLTGFDQQVVAPSWNKLLTLDLRHNKLQGSLPMPSISTNHYLLSNNSLTGIIPSWICELDNLQVLDLSNNKLSGMLPQCFSNFSDYLTILDLQNNKFHGSLPQTLMVGAELKMIDLSSNLLEGRIPRSLANCTKLEFLNLGDNQITDIFPSWLGFLPELQVLVLQSNKFYGVIKEPEADFVFQKLRIIDLSQNRFTGELPSKYFECWNAMKVVNTSQLTYMQDNLEPHSRYFGDSYGGNFEDYTYVLTLSYKGQELKYEKVSNMVIGILLSNNEFAGEIPISIGDLKGLQNLNLSNNRLSGQILSSLGNLKALESLDLSNNKFSGKIPQQLTELTNLACFNISHNHLTGFIPQGTQFDTFPNNSFEGNPGLCGKYVSKECIVEAPKEEAQGFYKSTFQFDLKIVLIGYARGTIAGVALGHVFVTTRKHEWFLMIFERLLKRIKRRREHRN